MGREEILVKVMETFRKVFPDEKSIGPETTVDDIVNWNSLNHITLILELEKQFALRFDLFEVIELRDVKGIEDFIASKINL